VTARLLPALLLVAACRATTPAPSTPAAAPPSLATLASVDPARAAFNDAPERRRILALFSPS
jgi:hypothetical protein